MQSNNSHAKKSIVIITLMSINATLTVFILIYLFMSAGNTDNSNLGFNQEKVEQYILYIGTNDKDTYEQIIPTDEAKKIVNEICAKYVSGYTVSESEGGWVDEKGILTQENTLVYTFTEAGEPEIISIMQEVLTALNQNSILVEKRSVSSAFYDGKEN